MHATANRGATRRDGIAGDQGFTMLELLVVILIIGVLAAIAIPSFLSQRNKAQDACAKQLLATAQKAAEVYSTENGGSYLGMTRARLNVVEKTLPTRTAPVAADRKGCWGSTAYGVLRNAASNARCGTAPSATNYCLRITSATTVRFNLARAANGAITRSCWVPAGVKRGGCPTTNRW